MAAVKWDCLNDIGNDITQQLKSDLALTTYEIKQCSNGPTIAYLFLKTSIK